MSDIRTNTELAAVVRHAIHLLSEPELHEDVKPGGVCESCASDAEAALAEILRRAAPSHISLSVRPFVEEARQVVDAVLDKDIDVDEVALVKESVSMLNTVLGNSPTPTEVKP